MIVYQLTQDQWATLLYNDKDLPLEEYARTFITPKYNVIFTYDDQYATSEFGAFISEKESNITWLILNL